MSGRPYQSTLNPLDFAEAARILNHFELKPLKRHHPSALESEPYRMDSAPLQRVLYGLVKDPQ